MFAVLFYVILLLGSWIRVDSLQCYRCTEDYRSPLNLTITADNFPPLGSTCKLTEAKHECITKIFVFFRDNVTTQTDISYGFDPMSQTDPTAITPGHYVRLGVSRQLIEIRWLKSIQYNCLTDGCNSADNMKRVLQATTQLTHEFEKLDSLIVPVPSFDPSSCRDFSNMTTLPCDPSVDINKCGQCKLMFYSPDHQTCARCVEFHASYAGSITRHAVFRLTDRSQSDEFDMQCSLNDCNSPSNIERIRQASTMIFDVDAYLGSAAVSLSFSFSLSVYFFVLVLFFN